jgi:hypothetical protein
MTSYRILVATFHVALARIREGKSIDVQSLLSLDKRFRQLKDEYPDQASLAELDEFIDEPAIHDPWEEIEVEESSAGIRRVIGPLEVLVEKRSDAMKRIVTETILQNSGSVRRVVSVLGEWMRSHTIVHVIGAGRALLAASLPANRLAHGGANVFILGDKTPPPNSRFGGGIIAASASGETRTVLEIMTFANEANKRPWPNTREIEIIGIARVGARKIEPYRRFPELCSRDCFLGIEPARDVELRGLADIEEYAISELLDALIVAAGLEIGVNFRLGHEDLVGGATGPWHQHKDN